MSYPKLAAVLATVGAAASPHDPARRTVWLFDIDENYSLDAVRRFFAMNEHSIGALQARHEIARFKNIKRLIAWSDRKGQNAAGLPPLTGWTGPFRLAPSA